MKNIKLFIIVTALMLFLNNLLKAQDDSRWTYISNYLNWGYEKSHLYYDKETLEKENNNYTLWVKFISRDNVTEYNNEKVKYYLENVTLNIQKKEYRVNKVIIYKPNGASKNIAGDDIFLKIIPDSDYECVFKELTNCEVPVDTSANAIWLRKGSRYRDLYGFNNNIPSYGIIEVDTETIQYTSSTEANCWVRIHYIPPADISCLTGEIVNNIPKEYKIKVMYEYRYYIINKEGTYELLDEAIVDEKNNRHNIQGKYISTDFIYGTLNKLKIDRKSYIIISNSVMDKLYLKLWKY